MTEPPKIKLGLVLVGDSIQTSGPKTCATVEGGTKKGHSYKPLPKQFCRDGFQYRQVSRELNATIYEQTCNGCRDPAVCFEVIRLKRRESFEIAGRLIPPAEVYPRSEQWGALGWTVPDKESAFLKLRELVNARKKKESANPVKKSPIQNTKRCSESKELCGDVKDRRDG